MHSRRSMRGQKRRTNPLQPSRQVWFSQPPHLCPSIIPVCNLMSLSKTRVAVSSMPAIAHLHLVCLPFPVRVPQQLPPWHLPLTPASYLPPTSDTVSGTWQLPPVPPRPDQGHPVLSRLARLSCDPPVLGPCQSSTLSRRLAHSPLPISVSRHRVVFCLHFRSSFLSSFQSSER